MKKKIILIGFMGSGKTTIGRKLSEKLGLDFVDLDAYIEEKQQKKISEFFHSDGEEVFRKIETKSLSELCESSQSLLISTGGGIVTVPENHSILKRYGFTIYLKALPDTILSRLEKDENRPLLMGVDKKKRIYELMEKRKNDYLRAADTIVEVDGLSVEDVVISCLKQV